MSAFTDRAPRVALSAAAFVLLNIVIGGGTFAAVLDFDVALIRDPGSVVERGAAVANLLRVGSFIDLLGYLALAPVVVHLHRRLDVPLLALAGLAAVLVGAIGAALIGAAGPWLLEASTADPSAQSTVRLEFGALLKLVVVGLWGTLELFLLGVWLVGVARHAPPDGRGFSIVGTLAGAGALAYAVRSGLTGQTPLAFESPLDPVILIGVGLIPVWFSWLALKLWRGR